MTPLIVVLGTTASGKSELALALAERLGGCEIISADSRQVYRGLDVGTGKVTPDERVRVPHHLLDVADVRERFTVATFQQLAVAAIEAVRGRGHVPILVGGSGLYIRSIVDAPAYPPVAPRPDVRAELEATPLAELAERLRAVDPVAAATIDLRNPRRVVRALEVTLVSGIPFSAQQHRHAGDTHAVLQMGLTWPRDELRRRIDRRVDARMAAHPSMLEETARLLAEGVPAERLLELGLEYRFLTRHLLGELQLEATIALLKSAIYQFARRQLTWFRRDSRIHWLDPERAIEDAGALTRRVLESANG